MLNRKKGPLIYPRNNLYIPPIVQYTLKNGIKVCEVNLGDQEILKMEIVHKAGRTYEKRPLISRATASLLKEGCNQKSSAQIAEEIDYYGSSIKTAANMDFAYSTVYTLTKHFENLLPLVYDIYTNPTFPEEEIQKFKTLNIQKLKEELSKNEVLAYRQITEEIFGLAHPYGYNSTIDDYNSVYRQDILEHHLNYFGTDNCYIFLSGKITDQVRSLVSDYFGEIKKTSISSNIDLTHNQVERKEIRLKSKGEHQGAIKTGRLLFDKHHEDNASFFLLNTILGGYFGSRLMTSIREDLGYTYDIHSGIDQMLFSGCFYISTEAAPEYVDPILKEIYHQMDVLKQEKVSDSELEMVKNYLSGNFLNMLDGPMNVSSFAKSMILVDKTPSDFKEFVSEINDLTAEKLISIAQKYLNKEQMKEVVVMPS